MLISVIIPAFNVSSFITQCLSCFENQVYKDFELIIVNDGSTDNLIPVVETYAKKSNMSIRLINQENAGVSAARNTGINQSLGQYICFVDADDLVAPQYLSDMIEIISSYNCDLVICGSKLVPENWEFSEYRYKKQSTEIFNSYETLKKFLYHDITSGVCFILVKKSIIQYNHLCFSQGYRYSEDLEMMWKIIAHSNYIACTRSELYLYRIRNGSAMSSVDEKRLDGFILMTRLESYFEKFRPDFLKEYKKYGVARWVWATLWQMAVASESYKSFKSSANMIKSKNNMRKLLTYPKMHVVISSLIYLIAPFLYYILLKKIGLKRMKNRNVTN